MSSTLFRFSFLFFIVLPSTIKFLKSKISILFILLLLFGCVSNPQTDEANKSSTNDSVKPTENTTNEPDNNMVNETVDLNKKCCQECVRASQQDPRGFDISIAPCSDYEGYSNDERDLSKECADYFRANQLTLGECRY